MISYRQDLRGVTPERLIGFWSGWPSPPAPEAHLRILEGSEAVELAIDTDAHDRVVGFITAIGDGVLASYIPLLEVLPAYRGQGIGTELVQRMLARLDDRYMVDLVCDEDVVPFYERAGMTPYGAMILRRPEVLRRTD
ncbi:MAG: GNAT family N-acetyltransferase [Acidimicrobiales bacterium]